MKWMDLRFEPGDIEEKLGVEKRITAFGQPYFDCIANQWIISVRIEEEPK